MPQPTTIHEEVKAKYGKKKVKFVQIAANNDKIITLDKDGNVYQYGQIVMGWSKIESPNEE